MIRVTQHRGSGTWDYDVQIGGLVPGDFYARATGSGESSRAAALRAARAELQRLHALEASGR